jgi:hypothetical protein
MGSQRRIAMRRTLENDESGLPVSSEPEGESVLLVFDFRASLAAAPRGV